MSQFYIIQVKRKHGIIERVNYNVGEGKAKVSQVAVCYVASGVTCCEAMTGIINES